MHYQQIEYIKCTQYQKKTVLKMISQSCQCKQVLEQNQDIRHQDRNRDARSGIGIGKIISRQSRQTYERQNKEKRKVETRYKNSENYKGDRNYERERQRLNQRKDQKSPQSKNGNAEDKDLYVRKKINKVKTANYQLINSIEDLYIEQERQKKQLDELKNTIEKLEKKIKGQQQQNQEAEHTIQKLEKKIKGQQQQNQEAKHTIQKLEKKIQGQQQQNQEAKHTIQKLEKKIQGQQQQIKDQALKHQYYKNKTNLSKNNQRSSQQKRFSTNSRSNPKSKSRLNTQILPKKSPNYLCNITQQYQGFRRCPACKYLLQ